jgi:hypothetical protein
VYFLLYQGTFSEQALNSLDHVESGSKNSFTGHQALNAVACVVISFMFRPPCFVSFVIRSHAVNEVLRLLSLL